MSENSIHKRIKLLSKLASFVADLKAKSGSHWISA